MDIHPMFVHFPIALLTIYALLEVLTVHHFFRTAAWVHIRAAFVIFGAGAAIVTLQTGEIAAELNYGGEDANELVSIHNQLATITTIIFCVIAVGYLPAIIKENVKLNSYYARLPITIIKVLDLVIKLITKSPLRLLLAVAGLAGITITGGLGGAIVYGPDVDPAVNFIYHIFFK
jgi:uncharacterized membrane protein